MGETCSDVLVHGRVTEENDHMLYISKRLQQRILDVFYHEEMVFDKDRDMKRGLP